MDERAGLKLGKKQVCFKIEESVLKQMEEIREATGLPVRCLSIEQGIRSSGNRSR
jgi:hypothetical protein